MTIGPVRLLSHAIRYASESVDAVEPATESLPTPCEGWDLGALLLHLNQSIDELRRTVALEQMDMEPGSISTAQPAATFRSHARLLLQSCIDGGVIGRRIIVGDRALASAWVVITAAAEIAVHGW